MHETSKTEEYISLKYTNEDRNDSNPVIIKKSLIDARRKNKQHLEVGKQLYFNKDGILENVYEVSEIRGKRCCSITSKKKCRAFIFIGVRPCHVEEASP